jgi:predicted MFS family arabinose efflux permease
MAIPARDVPDSRAYALAILTVAYTLSFVDRQIVSILAQPIKAELGLTDAQLGLLIGFAFALLYTVLGLPIAALADRGRRVDIVAASAAIWSLMTVACGAAMNFTQLFIARVGVGVGEAGCTPASHSMISDLYEPKERSQAMAIYALGIPIGGVLGILLGGWVAEFYGWRWAFVAAGLPGILVAILLKLTVPEPARKSPVAKAGGSWTSFAAIARKPTFWFLTLAGASAAFVGYGLFAWVPAFLIRTHDISLSSLATQFALLVGIAGGIGTWLGGWLTDRLAKRGRHYLAIVPAVALLACTPFYTLAIETSSATLALLILAVPTALSSMYYGPLFAMLHGVAPPQGRALASAIALFVINMVGLGLGPTVLGGLSDHLTAAHGEAGLGLAIAYCSLGFLGASALWFLAAVTVRRDWFEAEPGRPEGGANQS